MEKLLPQSRDEIEGAVNALVSKLSVEIERERNAFHERKLFLEQRVTDPDILERELKTAWYRFKDSIAPMQSEREYLIKQLTILELSKPLVITAPFPADISL